MRGITAIIAVILLLMISIAITGFAYFFLIGTVQTATNETSTQLQQQTNIIGESFAVEAVDKNKVIIRNKGITEIKNLKFYVDNKEINIIQEPPPIATNQIGTYILNLTENQNPNSLKISSLGLNIEQNVNGSLYYVCISNDECTAPPASGCADPNTKRTYNPAGTCNQATGKCEYSYTDSLCSSPPADECANWNTKRTYNSPGNCSGQGQCSYTSYTDIPCSLLEECASGVCSSAAMQAYTLTSNSDFKQGTYQNINDLNNDTIMIGGRWEKIGNSAGNYFVEVNGKLYIIGGDSFEGGPNNVTDELDTITYTVTKRKDMSKLRELLTVDTVNGKIYAIGGDATRWIEEYNASTNIWSWRNNSLDIHKAHSSVVYNGKIYTVGSEYGGYQNRTGLFDPSTRAVTRLADMAFGRDRFPLVLLNDKIYAIGGGMGTNTTEELDLTTNTWTLKNSRLPVPYLRYHQAHAVNNKIYIFGGYEQSKGPYVLYNRTYEFDPAVDIIREVSPMHYKRYRFDSVKINEFLYAISGATEVDISSSMEMYDVYNDKWFFINNLTEKGVRDFDAIIYENKIFVVGGVNGSGSYTDTIQVYALQKQGNFTSPVFDAGTTADKYFVNVTLSSEPLYAGTQIELLYSIDGAAFVSAGIVSGAGLATEAFIINQQGKNIQYKIIMTSDDVYLEQHSPVIQDITLNYFVI